MMNGLGLEVGFGAEDSMILHPLDVIEHRVRIAQ
jgi:hypothetical protein